jgi:hypothetical protein
VHAHTLTIIGVDADGELRFESAEMSREQD